MLVTVTDGNRAPFFEDGLSTTREVPEDAGQGASVGGPVTATDQNAGDTLTYTLDDPSGKFSINSSTGQITVAADDSLDHETQQDYSVDVTVSDRTMGGLYDKIEVKALVSDVNEPPTVAGNATLSYPENTATTRVLHRYTATDPENDSITWSVEGAGKDNFTIDASGNLHFSSQPDHETNEEYSITIVATDDGDPPEEGELQVTVEITNVDEPPVITGPCSVNDYTENGTGDVGAYSAADPEGAITAFTWSLSGTDRNDFDISNAGVLTFKNTPDYEQPSDSGSDNHYEVTVQATDSDNKRGQLHVDVIVNDVDEEPVLEGPDNVDTFPENSATSRQVGRYTATDPEGKTVTLSLTGPDSSAFSLASNGVVTFQDSPDYEEKSSYSLTVSATAGVHTVTMPVAVNIQNLEEPGTVTLSNVQPQAGTLLSATLEDDDRPSGTTWQVPHLQPGQYRHRHHQRNVGRLHARRGRCQQLSTRRGFLRRRPQRGQDRRRRQREPGAGPAAGPDAARVPGGRGLRTQHPREEKTRPGANLGAPVTATDINNDRLTYSVSVSGYFEIVDSTGQIRTVNALRLVFSQTGIVS